MNPELKEMSVAGHDVVRLSPNHGLHYPVVRRVRLDDAKLLFGGDYERALAESGNESGTLVS